MFGHRRDVALFEAISRQNEELREFIRETLRRNEKVWRAVLAELGETEGAVPGMKEALGETTAERRALRERCRAERKAVLAAIARFEASGRQAQA